MTQTAKRERPYCEPLEAGLASEAAAVGRRIGRLLDALGSEVTGWTVQRGPGTIEQEIYDFKQSLIDKLQADGWRLKINARDKWQVLPPMEKR